MIDSSFFNQWIEAASEERRKICWTNEWNIIEDW